MPYRNIQTLIPCDPLHYTLMYPDDHAQLAYISFMHKRMNYALGQRMKVDISGASAAELKTMTCM